MSWYIFVCIMIGGISVSLTGGLRATIVTTAYGDRHAGTRLSSFPMSHQKLMTVAVLSLFRLFLMLLLHGMSKLANVAFVGLVPMSISNTSLLLTWCCPQPHLLTTVCHTRGPLLSTNLCP